MLKLEVGKQFWINGVTYNIWKFYHISYNLIYWVLYSVSKMHGIIGKILKTLIVKCDT